MKVNVIKPKVKTHQDKKNVCAYARVSTDSNKQGDSLENQVAYYERLIKNKPNYNFVGVFSDFGISGTTDNRPQFQLMIEQAKLGYIDLIITKSISRFARNTTVLLKIARELKGIGVEIYFEKENISTLSGDGELLLTVLAAFAQEESKNISENIKWRFREDFKKGKIVLNTTRFLGYEKNKQGDLVINKNEARIIKRIFNMYLSGISTEKIAKILNNEGVKTVSGKSIWYGSSISYILKNEKYKGDAINQKTYKPNHLKGNSIKNNGVLNKYYIHKHHKAIISESDWFRVQELLNDNRKIKNVVTENKYQKKYPYTGILYCGLCGAKLKRRIWNGKLPSRKIVWQCSNYIKNGVNSCSGLSISEDILNKANIKGETVIREEIHNGKKHYSYTCKSEHDKLS